MTAAFHLARCYVLRHRLQTVLLAGALGLVLALPLAVRLLVRAAESTLRERSASTPQVIGARGSALDLLLTALYFKRQPLPPLPARLLDEVRQTGLGTAIPLHLRFHAQGAPIVGTQLEYFRLRRLHPAQGRLFGRLGDCVVGARLARQRGLKPGDAVFSSQEQVFDLAGIYPLKMRLTGVLAPSGSADDDAVFVDLKTAWLIEGLAHGHDDLARAPDSAVLERRTDGSVVGNASVRLFNEVTDANLAGFHFHGDTGGYPVSAIIVAPRDAKAEALLAGRYLDTSQPAQLIRPRDEFDALMRTLFRAERLALALFAATTGAAATVAVLVFALSFRLRRREFSTLDDLGVSRRSLALTKLLEIGLVGLLSLAVALLLTALVGWQAGRWVTLLLG